MNGGGRTVVTNPSLSSSSTSPMTAASGFNVANSNITIKNNPIFSSAVLLMTNGTSGSGLGRITPPPLAQAENPSSDAFSTVVDVTSVATWNNRGVSHYDRRDYVAALDAFRRALRAFVQQETFPSLRLTPSAVMTPMPMPLTSSFSTCGGRASSPVTPPLTNKRKVGAAMFAAAAAHVAPSSNHHRSSPTRQRVLGFFNRGSATPSVPTPSSVSSEDEDDDQEMEGWSRSFNSASSASSTDAVVTSAALASASLMAEVDAAVAVVEGSSSAAAPLTETESEDAESASSLEGVAAKSVSLLPRSRRGVMRRRSTGVVSSARRKYENVGEVTTGLASIGQKKTRRSSKVAAARSSSQSTGSHQLKQQQQHRSEYDEGVNSLARTLRIDDNFDVQHLSDKDASAMSVAGGENGVAQHIQRLIKVLYNIARVHHDMNRHDEAMELYHMALCRVEESGKDATPQPLLFALHNSVGQVQYHRGEHSDALKSFGKALKASPSSTGVEAASVLNCIGVLHYHMAGGNYQKAMQNFETSLRLRRQFLGATHVHVGTTLNNIGRVHFLRGDYDSAMAAYREALAIRKATFGPDHLDVAATIFNIGQAHHQRGEHTEAMVLYHEFARIAKLHFCGTHRDVAIVTTCIGQIHHERRDYAEAKDSYEEALRVARDALGEEHPEVAITLNKLGNLHYEQGDLDAALKLYQEGLQVEMAVLEPSNPNIVVTLTNVAEIYKQRDEHDKALEIYNRALSYQRRSASTSISELANTLSSIGYVLNQKADYSGALEVYQECLRLRREARAVAASKATEGRLLPSTCMRDMDTEVAATLTHIAVILLKKDMHDWALEVLMESYRIRVANGPFNKVSESRDLAFTLYNIGVIHHHRGMFEHALVYYRETARVEREALGEGHRDLGITYYNIGQVHYQCGDLGAARSYFKRALSIEQANFGPNHPTCARTLNEIGNIELQLGNAKDLVESFAEATRIYRKAGLSDDYLVIYGRSLYKFDAVHPDAAGAA